MSPADDEPITEHTRAHFTRRALSWPMVLLCLLGLTFIALLLLMTNMGRTTKIPVAEDNTGGVTNSPASEPTSTLALPNPGFETGLDNWKPNLDLVDGDSRNEGYSVLIDRSVHHSGTASARLQSITAQPPMFGGISSEMAAKQVRGKRVRYSAYVTTQDVATWAGLYMYVYRTQAGGTTLDKLPMSSDQMSDRWIRGTTDWRKYEIILDVPPEATLVTFGVELSGTGQVWIDDALMEIVGDDVPTKNVGEATELQNLDFEGGLTGWIPYTWRTTAQTDVYTMGTGLDMAHTGKLGAYIRSTAPPQSNQYGELGTPAIYAGYYQGKTVRFSAYINADKVEDHAILWLVSPTKDAQGRTIAVPNETVIPGKATQNDNSATVGRGGWQKYEVSIDVPADAPNLIFDLRLFGAGEVWIDDIEFTVLDNSAAP